MFDNRLHFLLPYDMPNCFGIEEYRFDEAITEFEKKSADVGNQFSVCCDIIIIMPECFSSFLWI